MQTLKFSEEFLRGGDDVLRDCCNGLENCHRELRDTQTTISQAEIDSIFSGDLEGQHPYKYLGNFFNLIHSTYNEKFRDLIGGVIESVNTKQYLITALCGRSIIECTALLRYYNDAVFEKVSIAGRRDLEGIDKDFLTEAFELASKHMHGSTMNWSAFFTSDIKTFVKDLVDKEKARMKREKPKGVDYIQSIHITKALDSWFDDQPELVALAYNFFSELVHPNLGSNLLLLGITDGKIQIGKTSNRAIGKTICREAIKYLAPCMKEGLKQLSLSIILSSLGSKLETQDSK
jgi:hypothetical protein